MTKSKIFLILSLSFIGGIFLASIYQKVIADHYFLLAIAFLLIPLVIFYPVRNNSNGISNGASKNYKIYIVAFAGLFFIFGWWLTDIRLQKAYDTSFAGQSFSGQAMIIKEPENNGKYQKIVAKIPLGSEASKSLKILINANIYPEYQYGDEINLNCTLETPKNYEDGFDYSMYLAKDGIYYVCASPKIELTNRNRGSKFYAGIFSVKNKFQRAIAEIIPAPESGLLEGILLGGDNKLPKNIQENFSKTGMTHIVAVSGYNVTIIAEYLMWALILIGLWRGQAFWAAIVGIFLFILMIGFPSSAVRAGVMGSLLLWAVKNGRLANSQNAIVFSAAVMLLINPMLLRWDVGFQLSFLATLGIVYLYPFWEERMVEKNKIFGVAEILGLTISAQIFVLPVIFMNFGRLSIISLLANVLILPVVPLTMLLGFIAVIFKLIFPILSAAFAWLAYLPLKYEVATINFLASLPWSSVQIEKFAWYWAAVWYILLMRIIFIWRKNKRQLALQNQAETKNERYYF
jgi:competence protein ComEC